jgi:hypothetical protein
MQPNEKSALKGVGWFGESGPKTYLRRVRKKLRGLTGPPDIDVEAAVEDPRVLVEECVRRDVDPSLTLLGTRRRGAVTHAWPADAGYGELLTLAYGEIKCRLDLHAVDAGAHVATVLVDLDAWEYEVVYEDVDDHDAVEEPALRADGGFEAPATQGWVREDETGQYVVCAGVDERGQSCDGRMRLDERAIDEGRWVWVCPDCEEALIQVRRGGR